MKDEILTIINEAITDEKNSMLSDYEKQLLVNLNTEISSFDPVTSDIVLDCVERAVEMALCSHLEQNWHAFVMQDNCSEWMYDRLCVIRNTADLSPKKTMTITVKLSKLEFLQSDLFEDASQQAINEFEEKFEEYAEYFRKKIESYYGCKTILDTSYSSSMVDFSVESDERSLDKAKEIFDSWLNDEISGLDYWEWINTKN